MSEVLEKAKVYDELSPRIRGVTDDEVAFFKKNGWVHLRGFIDPNLCDEVVDHYMKWSGLRWKEWPSDPAEQQEFIDTIHAISKRPKVRFAIRQDDPWMFNFVMQRQFGHAAARFLSVPAIKVLSETMHVKYPISSGHSSFLPWHQDWPSLPIDRAGAVQMWLPLVDVSPDMGPMTHLSGSNAEQPQGMVGMSGEDAKELYPELWEKYPAHVGEALAKGDAVFHHTLTWHASPENKTDRIRWAMSSIRFDARARYTGQHNHNTNGLGLTPNQLFDHPNFPTVYP